MTRGGPVSGRRMIGWDGGSRAAGTGRGAVLELGKTGTGGLGRGETPVLGAVCQRATHSLLGVVPVVSRRSAGAVAAG